MIFRTLQQLSLAAMSCLTAVACNTEHLAGVSVTRDEARPAYNQSSSNATAPAAATTGWNALVRTLAARNALNQQAALRAFAYVTFAEHASLVALDSSVHGVGLDARGQQELARVALSHAAAGVLDGLFPNDHARIAAELSLYEPGAVHANTLTRVMTGAALSAGSDDLHQRLQMAAVIGSATAQAMLDRARTDRFTLVWNGTVPTGHGVWASAFNPARAPLLPRLGEARTFFLTRGDQFRPVPPPAPGSQAFQQALAEVRGYSDTRTPEQQRIAEFWAMATGSLAAGYWSTVADSLITRDRLSEADAAHALALMNMAAWDANVACHDAKYTYWLARPTQMDKQITLAIALPNHPSYPSNHGCLSGAAGAMLGTLFPKDATALKAMTDEAAISRVYAGLHYRFDGETGLDIGRKVAALAAHADTTMGGRFSIR
jgi:hypothetical protein